MEANSNKSKTVSFRVPEDIITEIEKEAKTKLVSTNVLINQILHEYVAWYRYKQKMRTFPIPEDSLSHFLECLNESQRNEAVDIAYSSIRDWTLVSKKKFDLHSCLESLEDYCRIAGVSVEDSVLGGGHSFIIRHNLGMSTSLFITQLTKKIFWELKKINIESQATKATVISKPLSTID